MSMRELMEDVNRAAIERYNKQREETTGYRPSVSVRNTTPIDLSPPVNEALAPKQVAKGDGVEAVSPKQVSEGDGGEVLAPRHYDKGGKQVWDLMKDLVSAEEYRGYLTLNVVKYVSRYKQKGGKQDLLKARAYIDKLIETEYREESK
jgi:hypothetical protein